MIAFGNIVKWGLAVVAGTSLNTTVLAGEPTLVWSDKDAVQVWRSQPDGTNPQLLYSAADGLRDPRGIAVDVTTNVLYLADNRTNAIYIGGTDGTTPLTPIITGQSGPADIALGGGKLYWADQDGNRIRRSNLDGTAVETILSGLNEPYYVTVDPVNSLVYWADNDSGTIHRATTTGGSPTNVVTGLDRVRDVELDLVAGKIYWADRDRSDIRRQNLDGTGMEVLFNAADGLGRPHGMWLDVAQQMIYWTDTTMGDVLRGNMDGIGRPEILYNGPPGNGPWELQLVVPEPGLVRWLAVPVVMLLVNARRRRV